MDTFSSVMDSIVANGGSSDPGLRTLLLARAEVTRAQANFRRAQERYADVHGDHHVGDHVMVGGGECVVDQSWAEITPLGVLSIWYIVHPLDSEDIRLMADEKELSKGGEL